MLDSENLVQQLLDQPDLFARSRKEEKKWEREREREAVGGGGERLEAENSPVIVASRLLSTSVCFPSRFPSHLASLFDRFNPRDRPVTTLVLTSHHKGRSKFIEWTVMVVHFPTAIWPRIRIHSIHLNFQRVFWIETTVLNGILITSTGTHRVYNHSYSCFSFFFLFSLLFFFLSFFNSVPTTPFLFPVWFWNSDESGYQFFPRFTRYWLMVFSK